MVAVPVLRVVVVAPRHRLRAPLEVDTPWRHGARAPGGVDARRHAAGATAVAGPVRHDVLGAIAVVQPIGMALLVVRAVDVQRGHGLPAVAADGGGDGHHGVEAVFPGAEQLHDELRPGAVSERVHAVPVDARLLHDLRVGGVEALLIVLDGPAALVLSGEVDHQVLVPEGPRLEAIPELGHLVVRRVEAEHHGHGGRAVVAIRGLHHTVGNRDVGGPGAAARAGIRRRPQVVRATRAARAPRITPSAHVIAAASKVFRARSGPTGRRTSGSSASARQPSGSSDSSARQASGAFDGRSLVLRAWLRRIPAAYQGARDHERRVNRAPPPAPAPESLSPMAHDDVRHGRSCKGIREPTAQVFYRVKVCVVTPTASVWSSLPSSGAAMTRRTRSTSASIPPQSSEARPGSIGSCTMTRTTRPLVIRVCFLPNTCRVPSMLTGRIGSSKQRARAKPPLRKCKRRPLGLRVPSGATQTLRPSSRSSRPRSCITRYASAPRLRSMHTNCAASIALPQTGIRKSSCFATMRKDNGSAQNNTGMS